jgi:hypothetical protein
MFVAGLSLERRGGNDAAVIGGLTAGKERMIKKACGTALVIAAEPAAQSEPAALVVRFKQ